MEDEILKEYLETAKKIEKVYEANKENYVAGNNLVEAYINVRSRLYETGQKKEAEKYDTKIEKLRSRLRKCKRCGRDEDSFSKKLYDGYCDDCWHEVKGYKKAGCKQCGKPVWQGTSEGVYCNECYAKIQAAKEREEELRMTESVKELAKEIAALLKQMKKDDPVSAEIEDSAHMMHRLLIRLVKDYEYTKENNFEFADEDGSRYLFTAVYEDHCGGSESREESRLTVNGRTLYENETYSR
jgi:hypothetical protein